MNKKQLNQKIHVKGHKEQNKIIVRGRLKVDYCFFYIPLNSLHLLLRRWAKSLADLKDARNQHSQSLSSPAVAHLHVSHAQFSASRPALRPSVDDGHS